MQKQSEVFLPNMVQLSVTVPMHLAGATVQALHSLSATIPNEDEYSKTGLILSDDAIPAHFLHVARLERKIPIVEMEKLTRIPAEHLREMENNTRNIGTKNAFTIAKVLSIEPQKLFNKSEIDNYYSSTLHNKKENQDALQDWLDLTQNSHGSLLSTLPPRLRQTLALDAALQITQGDEAPLLSTFGITRSNFDYENQFFGTPHIAYILQNDKINVKLPIRALALQLLGLDDSIIMNWERHNESHLFSSETELTIKALRQEAYYIERLWYQQSSEHEVYPRIFYEWADKKDFILPYKIIVYLFHSDILVQEKDSLSSNSSFAKHDAQPIDHIGPEEFIALLRSQGTHDVKEIVRHIDANFTGAAKISDRRLGQLLPANEGVQVGYEAQRSRGKRLRQQR